MSPQKPVKVRLAKDKMNQTFPTYFHPSQRIKTFDEYRVDNGSLVEKKRSYIERKSIKSSPKPTQTPTTPAANEATAGEKRKKKSQASLNNTTKNSH